MWGRAVGMVTEAEGLPARRAEAARGAKLVLPDADDARISVDHHHEGRGVGDQHILAVLANAEPDQHRRQPGNRRDEAEELQRRIEQPLRSLERAEQQAERRAQQARR